MNRISLLIIIMILSVFPIAAVGLDPVNRDIDVYFIRKESINVGFSLTPPSSAETFPGGAGDLNVSMEHDENESVWCTPLIYLYYSIYSSNMVSIKVTEISEFEGTNPDNKISWTNIAGDTADIISSSDTDAVGGIVMYEDNSSTDTSFSRQGHRTFMLQVENTGNYAEDIYNAYLKVEAVIES